MPWHARIRKETQAVRVSSVLSETPKQVAVVAPLERLSGAEPLAEAEVAAGVPLGSPRIVAIGLRLASSEFACRMPNGARTVPSAGSKA